jgi:hypothetical protein
MWTCSALSQPLGTLHLVGVLWEGGTGSLPSYLCSLEAKSRGSGLERSRLCDLKLAVLKFLVSLVLIAL